MRLNPDCIRAVLLWLGENQHINAFGKLNSIPMYTIAENLTAFPRNDVLYSIKQMIESGLLSAQGQPLSMRDEQPTLIWDITPKGHEFLDNVQCIENWEATKEQASKVGSFSLSVLASIAANLIMKAVQSL
jgi:hypothetical protein